MENTITIAALGLTGTVVACLVWVVKYFANTLSKDLREHTEAALKQAQASEEVLRFMQNLNGKLEGAFVDKVAEKNHRRRKV